MSWIFILDHYTCNEHSINVSLSMSLFSTVYCFGFQFYHIKLPHCITLFDNAINQKRRVLLHVSNWPKNCNFHMIYWYLPGYFRVGLNTFSWDGFHLRIQRQYIALHTVTRTRQPMARPLMAPQEMHGIRCLCKIFYKD